ncbi:hypothetical protein E4099_16200 [Streptomyces palmae]|uniref:Lipoprotein n=2 Tax=Streptomyces palmae TaxID=1701085 RepID=A0A4Z0HBG1_9ACTN|nr:hypothetical protein E4099_16200 [Streptomyces palmae]
MVGGIALTFGLAACGSEKSDGDSVKDAGTPKAGGAPAGGAIAALQLASKATGEQHSAKVEGTNKMGPGTSTMAGEMDWANGMRANMKVTQSGGPVAGSPLEGKATPVRYTPDAMYMNLGGATGTPGPGGKHWVKYDWDTLAQKAGPAGAFLKDQMQNNNPARSVQLVLATGQVKAVGKESVRGVQATHYSGTVNVADLAKLQSKDLSQKDLSDLQKQLKASGTETETIDLWIDEKDLLVKKREYGKNNNGGFDSTVYYSDYGVNVTVEEPPASDTVGFEELGQ